MPRSRYLIVGGGMAAGAGVQGIRELDPSGSITILCEEGDALYTAPLSKGLWKGGALDDIRRPASRGAELLLGRRAERPGPVNRARGLAAVSARKSGEPTRPLRGPALPA